MAATTSAVPLNAATITQYLTSQSGLPPGKRRAVLLRAAPSWAGPAELAWGAERQARVVAAPSPLAVHELVLTHLAPGARTPDVLVVLTDREDAELGPDLLAKAYKQRINNVDIWEVVREAFGAEFTDRRLLRENWAAESLLDATPPGGWPQLAGGQLTRRKALTSLALRRLGIGPYDPDLDLAPDGHSAYTGPGALDIHALLRWALTPGGPDRYLALRAPERAGLKSFLGEEDQTGLTGRALLALVDAEHGPDAVAFGLVCAALWDHADAAADADDYRARGRAERWFGEEPPEHGELLDALVSAFGRSCEEFVSGLLLTGRNALEEDASALARRLSAATLDRAATLARQFGAERAAQGSPVLAAGMESRFTAVGRALAGTDPQRTAQAVAELSTHSLAPGSDARTRRERARMAQRLTQWLATSPEDEAGRATAGIGRHMSETGWVDLALEHIEAGGDPDPVLKSAYDTLCATVRAHRRRIDRAFARSLADWTAGNNDPGSTLTVETFLPRVVGRLVKSGERRVLLLVLDGMSAAVALELGEQLREHWAEYDPVTDTKDVPRRRAMAAALPTITAVSRTSLFAAKLMQGSQADERRLFPAHRFWGEDSASVFHKDDLRGASGGDTFSPALREALADERRHVAVVLNTVDDRLAKEQKSGDGAWRLSDIGDLEALLREAAAQGRAVILTSDHGHVVDRHGAKADSPGMLSARHRAPGGPLGATEIALRGPRVVSPETRGEIVALWDTDSRYVAQKAGHHGGAAVSEVAIPVLAFLPFGATPPKGWRELGGQQPPWWSLNPQAAAAVPAELVPAASPVPAPKKQSPKRAEREAVLARSHDSLFDMVLAPSTGDADALLTAQPVVPGADLVSRLVSSEIFLEQLELLTRKPTIPRVEKAVRALLDTGGTLPVTALGQRIGLPAGQNPAGFAAVLRQVLNYDGEQVLESLPDGRTLKLNVGLLKDQFDLR